MFKFIIALFLLLVTPCVLLAQHHHSHVVQHRHYNTHHSFYPHTLAPYHPRIYGPSYTYYPRVYGPILYHIQYQPYYGNFYPYETYYFYGR